MMMHRCHRCMTSGALVILALGLAFLLRDLGVWNFWNIQWWTAVFLLMGLAKLSWGHCKECEGVAKDMKKKKR